MRRSTRYISGLAFAGIIAIAASADAGACAARPFVSYIEEVQQAIESAAVPPAERARLADLLQTASTGSGPLWLGDRQKALNEALTALGHKVTGAPPLAELTDGQRANELHRRALLSLRDLVAMAADATLKPEAHQRLADTLVAVRHDVEQGHWQDTIDRSDAVEMDLGLVLPAKCAAGW